MPSSLPAFRGPSLGATRRLGCAADCEAPTDRAARRQMRSPAPVITRLYWEHMRPGRPADSYTCRVAAARLGTLRFGRLSAFRACAMCVAEVSLEDNRQGQERRRFGTRARICRAEDAPA